MNWKKTCGLMGCLLLVVALIFMMVQAATAMYEYEHRPAEKRVVEFRKHLAETQEQVYQVVAEPEATRLKGSLKIRWAAVCEVHDDEQVIERTFVAILPSEMNCQKNDRVTLMRWNATCYIVALAPQKAK